MQRGTPAVTAVTAVAEDQQKTHHAAALQITAQPASGFKMMTDFFALSGTVCNMIAAVSSADSKSFPSRPHRLAEPPA